jgi:TonB family protein
MDETGGEVVREPFAVTFAGQPFFRADYKQIFNGGTQSGTFVCTKLRGYFLGWMFVAGSPEELEEFVKSLQRLSFLEDEPGAAGGTGGSAPSTPESNAGRPLRVRVSQGVSTGLLVTKVRPQYPEVARQAGIQGTVVLKALLDTNGDVEELTLVSGHPMLVPAAIEAVKQWNTSPTCSMVRL